MSICKALTQECSEHFNEKKCLFIFAESAKADVQKDIKAELETMSKEDKYKEMCFFYDFTKTAIGGRVKDYLYGTSDKSPCMIILNLKDKGKKYATADDIVLSAKLVREYADQFLKGDLKTHVKSQARPKDDADPSHKGIKIVVASSFDEIVLDETKDVFFDVYADWCGPCVAVKPHILAVAEVLHDMGVKNLVVAKMDSQLNDSDSKYLPENYIPVLKFFPKEKDSKWELYEGKRNYEGILKFLHGKVKDRKEDAFDLDKAMEKCKAIMDNHV
jgi:protein disulfide-isomerase A1